MSTHVLDSDELAALEEQRKFLLDSLADLEREHEAGDVDEEDYLSLRDDYTVRAARVIRAIEAHEVKESKPPQLSRNWWRPAAVIAGVLAFAVLAGVLVAQASGRRSGGEAATGNIRESVLEKLDEANALANQRRLEEAIVAYDEALELDPDNVEAMTYKGWFQFQSGSQDGLLTLIDAAELDPDFPDVHAFLAIVFSSIGRTDTANAELARLESLNPPPEMVQMVRAELGVPAN